LGVIGVISPWNFPLILSVRSVVPAIALGNTVVVKPASDAPVSGALLIARLFEEAGCPEGVLNAVVGSGSEIGDYFVDHPIPRLISFTGSTEVGKRVGQRAMSGETIKRIALELGGNSPLVVLDDADIDAAVGAAVIGRFIHQGQICMSTNRIIVDKAVEKQFLERFVDGVSKLKVGNPAEPDTIIGPIINQSQLDGLNRKIAASQSGDVKLLCGGPADGLLLPPHVFSPVEASHVLCREETFGPLVPVSIAENEAHALQLANDTQHGLSSAVFTENMERGLNFARRIYAGMTHINDITVDDQPLAPFGGEKNSGLGRFNGDYIMEEFTRAHWITWKGTGM
jgi:aldehyde dehydrogenase (NAD+)